MPARLIRTLKIWRFLPEYIKESWFPRQIELPRVYYHRGTLYIYYIIRNRHIIVIAEPVEVKDRLNIRKSDKIIRELIELLALPDSLIIDKASKQVKELLDTLELVESLSVVKADRKFRWIRDVPVVLSDQITYVTSDKYVTTKTELINVSEQFNYSTYDRVTRSITEYQSVRDYHWYVSKERKFWWFRDVVYVLDGIFGGYPSPEYPGKMQYFRVLTERVFPWQYKFWTKTSILNIAHFFGIPSVSYYDQVNLQDILEYLKRVLSVKEYQELIQLIDDWLAGLGYERPESVSVSDLLTTHTATLQKKQYSETVTALDRLIIGRVLEELEQISSLDSISYTTYQRVIVTLQESIVVSDAMSYLAQSIIGQEAIFRGIIINLGTPPETVLVGQSTEPEYPIGAFFVGLPPTTEYQEQSSIPSVRFSSIFIGLPPTTEYKEQTTPVSKEFAKIFLGFTPTAELVSQSTQVDAVSISLS